MSLRGGTTKQSMNNCENVGQDKPGGQLRSLHSEYAYPRGLEGPLIIIQCLSAAAPCGGKAPWLENLGLNMKEPCIM